MTEENHEKPQSDWSIPGFERGTSPIRVQCVYHRTTTLGKCSIVLATKIIMLSLVKKLR